MAEIASAFVTIAPSAKGFASSLNRQVGPDVNRAGTGIGAGLGKSMLKGFIAIGAGIQIAQFLGDSLAEARDANKVAALTANVIKTTGGVAKVTAVQVDRLANSLSVKTGIDDEQIASSENLLLTFKNVRREGEGLANIFGRATRASIDLSAAGFGDTAGTAKMLGKALNDPVKGITALSRAGVTFTEQQKEQISTLVESGHALQAQKLILAEVESQVKGAAEAQATSSDKARVAMANLKETIGQSLVPAVDAASALFANKIAPAITTFVTNLQSGSGATGRFAAVIRDDVLPVIGAYYTYIFTKVVPAIRDGLVPWLQRGEVAFNQIRSSVQANRPQLNQLASALKKVADFILTKNVPAILKFASYAIPVAVGAIQNMIAVIRVGVNAFNGAKAAINATSNTITLAAKLFGVFSTVVRQKVTAALATIKTIPAKVRGALSGASSILYAAGQAIIDGLIRGISSKIGALTSKLSGLAGIIKAHKGPPAKDRVMLVPAGKLIMDGLIEGIRSKEGALADTLNKVGDKVGKKLKEKIRSVTESLNSVKDEFAGLVDPIASNFTQGLFEFDTAGAFTANLTTVKGTLSTLIANFNKLKGEGLSPGFLYKLFEAGGPSLINSLASLPADQALGASNLFGDVMSLGDQLGTAVAGATDKGAGLQNQTTALTKKLDELIKHVDHAADRTGSVVNGAASNGHRRGKSNNGGRRAA